MVDHVEFESPQLIESLLTFWRKTATQRFGYLLGRYERYDQVPLGVKAVVEAVHEPPQQGELDGVQVGLPWEDEGRMEMLAGMCGLKVVGVIYTDLVPDEETPEAKRAGKVLCKRHADAFFLSSLETIFAASQQLHRPNPSRYSVSGRFSSRFVTCVLTGNQDGAIDVSAYQVSDQAMAMVGADMIEASVDPSTVRLKEENRSGSKEGGGALYVPDVFYRYKNKYGIDVKENAKPCFPVDYLLVSVRRCLCPTPFAKADAWACLRMHSSRTAFPPHRHPSSAPPCPFRRRTDRACKTRASKTSSGCSRPSSESFPRRAQRPRSTRTPPRSSRRC